MGDITKQLFKDDHSNNFYSELRIKDKNDSQPREVVFSKKVTTKGDNIKSDKDIHQGLHLYTNGINNLNVYRDKDNVKGVLKKSSSIKTIKTNKGVVDIPKLDLNVIKPKENDRKMVQSKSFVNEYSHPNSNMSKLNSNHSNDNIKSLNKSYCEDKPKVKMNMKGN
jgi:hypothetical protein